MRLAATPLLALLFTATALTAFTAPPAVAQAQTPAAAPGQIAPATAAPGQISAAPAQAPIQTAPQSQTETPRPALQVVDTPAAVPAEPPAADNAAVQSRAPLQVIQAPEVGQVEAYLNGIGTLQAHFIQTANDGTQKAGTFTLKRPGRLRFEYEGADHDFIVADGTFIHYYDAKLKQDSSALISKSLADFFLRRDLKISGDLKVTHLERQDGLLLLTVMDSKDEGVGTLTLGFTENPMQLKKWRIVDSQGAKTEIELFDIKTGLSLDNKMFDYYDPQRGKHLNK